jgi:hypothetical protein
MGDKLPRAPDRRFVFNEYVVNWTDIKDVIRGVARAYPIAATVSPSFPHDPGRASENKCQTNIRAKLSFLGRTGNARRPPCQCFAAAGN